MSQTNNQKRKIAKKIARRKAYEKQRNLQHGLSKAKKLGLKLKSSQFKAKGPEIDGAEWYKQMKEKETNDQKSQQKGKGIKGFFQNLFRGSQRGQ